MRIARRVAFAAPIVLVVAGCHRPAAQRPDDDDDDDDDDDERAPAATAPADAAMPDAWRAPDELVVELKPLTSDRTIEDFCRHARCNPPPPYARTKPDPVEVKAVRVTAMKREGTGSRVRLSRYSKRMDEAWRAVFITGAGDEVPDGDCKIVAWDYRELECTTALSPEQLTGRREPFEVRLIPPKELVARVERERAAWRDPDRPGKSRVINVRAVASGTRTVIAWGRSNGVAEDWIVTFVDANGTALANGLCTIVSVNERTTTCTTTLTVDQVRAAPQVMVRPAKP